jgi:hypothetical protein
VGRNARMITRALTATALALVSSLGASAAAGAATPLPDLAISRSGPTTVYARAPFSETITVTNKGTATATGVLVGYRPALTVGSPTPGVGCAPVYQGHSGRGGGYTLVGYECTPTLKKGLKRKKSLILTLSIVAPGSGSINEIVSAAPTAGQGQLNKVAHAIDDVISVIQPPLPAAPTGVSATRVGDALQVSWTPDPATAAALTSSTITLTPTAGSSAPTVIGTSAGSSGGAAGPVEPQTTYVVTVVNSDAAGSSPPSSPIEYTTPASSVPPSAPGELRSWWLNPTEPIGSYLVAWGEASPGDSPVDEYQITATPQESEVASALTNYEPASSRETEFTGNSETPWSISVRAHNAAGWGAWSTPTLRGGL